jgi:hypothetical protein
MIIFVGDKPSPRMKPGAKPFEGAACEKRLMAWIEQLVKRRPVWRDCELHNRIDERFEFHKARALYFGYHLIALGNNASKALKGIPHFKLPHPSGRNRQINDKEFIKKKLLECKKWLKEQK